MTVPTLAPGPDRAVRSAREELAGVQRPDALYLLATGVGLMAERLDDAREVPLGGVAGVPAHWCETSLVTGRLGGLSVWLAEDVTPETTAPPEPAWSAGFPCWLAAACRATVLVYASAGCGLAGGPARGSLAVLTDHIRFGDANPLMGLGESELGPLFPDLSRLHDSALRERTLELATARGISAGETVAALTAGPSLDTPAERALLAKLGAGLVIQGASAPLLAAGHAGLAVLAVAAVTDDGPGEAQLADILAASQALAPALEEVLVGMADAVLERSRVLDRERVS